MKLRALELPVNGSPRQVELRQELEQIQRAVGGLIEVVSLRNGCVGLVDREARLKGKARNEFASDLAHGLAPGGEIVGTMLVVGPMNREGDFTDVPHEVLVEMTIAWVARGRT
jgi:Domain of unknown function (DUF3846)